MVTKKLNRIPAGAASNGIELDIANGLFPRLPITDWKDIPISDVVCETQEWVIERTPFTAVEIKTAGSRLVSGKAPGLDAVPN